VRAMEDGAYDYLTKPFQLEDVKATILRALEKRELSRDKRHLRQELKWQADLSSIVGQSAPMAAVFEMIAKAAPTRSTILITGESGTGKELVARAVHGNSPRAREPFITVNCGAIPSELMESELFGYMRGSFTGATRDKPGLFLAASGGSIFLDEVAELPLPLQVKLLRTMQERRILPVGGTREIETDARVIAATNRDLAQEVAAGRFREDLYYRLNVIQIRMPPLRERKEDLPLLVQHLVKRACDDLGREPMRVSLAAMMILQNHDFPGNVRELSNILERAVALEATDQIRPQSLPPALLERGLEAPPQTTPEPGLPDISQGIDLDALLERREHELIAEALRITGGIKTDAARLLGISFRSLRYRLKKLGIDEDDSEDSEG